MTRTIVGFEPLGTDTVFKLEDAPQDIPGIGENERADVTPLAAGSITGRGLELVARLHAHPAVKAGLDQILALPATAAPEPLYFHLVATAADELPWEELYVEHHGFCALDRRWPVARIARRRRPMRPRVYDAPLHVVAVISAAKRSGVGQLDALLTSLAREDPTHLGVTLHVISGEQAVLDRAAQQHPDKVTVTTETIAGTTVGLTEQIAQAEPDILHLLCHGGVVGEPPGRVRTLVFANTTDFLDPDAHETGSIALPVPALVRAVNAADPWLIVLAACETAEATEGPAMAHELVENGIPAVIGMRHLVDLVAVERFCAAFYPEAFSLVRAAVEAPGDAERTLDWASALTAPRMVLGSPDPAQGTTWSDPVLYVQEDDLRVAVPQRHQLPSVDYEKLRGKLDLWESYLASQNLSLMDPAALTAVMDQITSLQQQLANR